MDEKIGGTYDSVYIKINSWGGKKKTLKIQATYTYFYKYTYFDKGGNSDLVKRYMKKSFKKKKLLNKYIDILETLDGSFSDLKKTKLKLD
mmetsp:Transcript_3918/g.7465  ORF Transcript_3918/g.7465 Transcript_3918/m.7465 type:complete len:90 (+) Transcript_3918:225-494(+)